MAVGPGKYDDEAMSLLLRDRATAVAMIVLGGSRGPIGTALKVAVAKGPHEMAQAREHMLLMADLFRKIAKEIEKDVLNPELKADP